MKIKPFQTERFFARHEFRAPYLLCASDCESLTIEELLQLTGASWKILSELSLSYTESQGAPPLREQVATLYASLGPDDIVGLGAPEEGIFLAMHALLEPGDEVVVLAPSYDSLINVAEYLGCNVARWDLSRAPEVLEGQAGWRLELDTLDRLVTSRTKLVVVNFPHNPTGYLPTHSEWRSIIDIISRAGAWLFSDEMYRGLEHKAGARLVPACDLYERAVTLAGLSKAYGLPGLRTGWLALRDHPLRDLLLGWKDYTTICASAPSEALAQIALQAGDLLVDRSRRIVLHNLAVAEPFFSRWQTLFDWNRPLAGSVALVTLRSHSAVDFCQRLLARQGVALLPGESLGSDDRHVRFGFGRRGFGEALDQLDRYLTQTWIPSDGSAFEPE